MQQAAVELKFSSVAEVGLPYPVDVVFNCLKSSMYFLPLLAPAWDCDTACSNQ